MNIVEMKGITIEYQMKKTTVTAVSHVDFEIKRGFITALVGESGSGKTTLANAILKIISRPGVMTEGSIRFNSNDGTKIQIKELTERNLQKFRWKRVSMVFQASQNALNPLITIFEQFYETAIAHDNNVTKTEVYERCVQLLKYVKLDPIRVLKAYPHELSGGMKQRVMIAFSLLLNPELIILDEPTTALDVITQDYIFRIFKKINKEFGISMLLMTHDMAIVAKYADYVGVMYQGKLVEYDNTINIFKNSKDDYTKRLIDSTPSLVGEVKAFVDESKI